MKILSSGKAERKMREIIGAQGGNLEVKPEELPIGRFWIDIKAEKNRLKPRLIFKTIELNNRVGKTTDMIKKEINNCWFKNWRYTRNSSRW